MHSNGVFDADNACKLIYCTANRVFGLRTIENKCPVSVECFNADDACMCCDCDFRSDLAGGLPPGGEDRRLRP